MRLGTPILAASPTAAGMPQDPPVVAGGIADGVPGIRLECLERGLAVAFQLSLEPTHSPDCQWPTSGASSPAM
jgi:hypothetical protein